MVGWIDNNLWVGYLAIIIWIISSFILFLCYKRALKTEGYITNGKYASLKDRLITLPLFFINWFSFFFSLVVLTVISFGIIFIIFEGLITVYFVVRLMVWPWGLLYSKRLLPYEYKLRDKLTEK